MLTQATTSNSTNKHSLSQDGSSDRSRQEMGHLSSILCSHKQQHLTAQTNTAYHKMGHLIGAAKRWDISAVYCAHTSNTSITAQTNTAYHKMGHQIRAAKRWGHLSSILCSHTQHRHSHKHHIQDVGAAKANRSLKRDVQSTFNGVGATNHNTLSPWHAQDTSVL